MCRGYKAPSRIDPRLLDPKHLFQARARWAGVCVCCVLRDECMCRAVLCWQAEGAARASLPPGCCPALVRRRPAPTLLPPTRCRAPPSNSAQEVEDAPKNAGPDALLKQKVKQRRFREGYADGISTTHKPLPAAAFIAGDNPVELLGNCTALVLDGPASEGERGGAAEGVHTGAWAGLPCACCTPHPPPPPPTHTHTRAHTPPAWRVDAQNKSNSTGLTAGPTVGRAGCRELTSST